MTTVTVRPKLFKKKLVFKAYKNSNHSCLSSAGQFEWPKFIALQTRSYSFWDDDDNCEWSQQRYNKGIDKIIFRTVSVVCVTAETRCVNWFIFDVLKALIREFYQTTTATATGTSPNKTFDEQNNSCASAFWNFVHLFAVLCKTTTLNDQVLCSLEDAKRNS